MVKQAVSAGRRAQLRRADKAKVVWRLAAVLTTYQWQALIVRGVRIEVCILQPSPRYIRHALCTQSNPNQPPATTALSTPPPVQLSLGGSSARYQLWLWVP